MTQPSNTATKSRTADEIYTDVLAAALATGISHGYAIACAVGAAEHNWSDVRRALISAKATHADHALQAAYYGN